MNICPVGDDAHLGEMSVPFVPAQRSNFQIHGFQKAFSVKRSRQKESWAFVFLGSSMAS